MNHVEDRFVLEINREEVHTLIDSLMYAQGMTQEYLTEEEIGITVHKNISRVNDIMDVLLELVAVKV
jgi:hypothetical protein